MASIFVSYARKNRRYAADISTFLRENGHRVWWDVNLRAGTKFHEELRDQITKADYVIVIWSKESVLSEFVVDEASLAKKLGKMVPVRIDNCELPLGFGGRHTIDLTVWPERLKEVLGAVGGLGVGGYSLAPANNSSEPARIKLSKVERLVLINQLEIKSLLNPKEKVDNDLMVKQLARGYVDRLEIFDTYIQDELSDEVSAFVFEVLEMYRDLTFSMLRLKGKKRKWGAWSIFPGFDGNLESEHLAYARYLLIDEQLYAELHRDFDYNSHHPTIESYMLMLDEWRKVKGKANLLEVDVERILNAASS